MKTLFRILIVTSLPALLLADSISLQTPTTNPNIGDTFMMDVSVAGIADLYAFQFDVIFDPTVLSAVSVTEGDFLPSGGTTFFIPGTIDNVGGAVTANADTLIGTIPGVTGDGTLLQVEFTALASGTTAVSFGNEILLDSSLNDITVDTTFQNGSVTIGSASVPELSTLPMVGICLVVVLPLIAIRRSSPFQCDLLR